MIQQEKYHQKNVLLTQATQKNTCQIFLTGKILESKFQTPKIFWSSPSLEIRIEICILQTWKKT